MQPSSNLHVHVLASGVSDNFFFLLQHQDHGVLVDPIDAKAAIEKVQSLGLERVDLLNTHWHPDHTRGNAEVMAAFPQARHFGPVGELELVASQGDHEVTDPLAGGDTFNVGEVSFEVLDVPGHTEGHIALLSAPHFISGDVIFRAGAGHCYSGDPAVFAKTCREVVAPLSGELIYYPGHDYTKKNLEFALSLEPSYAPVKTALDAMEESTQQGRQRELVLHTLESERQVNPFMRVEQESLQHSLRHLHGDVWKESQDELGPDALVQDVAFCTIRTLRNSW